MFHYFFVKKTIICDDNVTITNDSIRKQRKYYKKVTSWLLRRKNIPEEDLRIKYIRGTPIIT